MKTAIIGSGFIGRAWAIVFARAGHEVALWDATEGAAEAARAFAAEVLPDLAANDLLQGQDPAPVLARLSLAPSLASACEGAGWAQESGPEHLETKRTLLASVDAALPGDAILASSTSSLLPSAFADHLAGRARTLVVHPINPPYLIPAAELVPGPWTDPAVVARARDILLAAGQRPIMMTRELAGFVMNRLQGALLEEAFRLVADGYASAEDVDVGLREGLALRWSFMGPFETIDLNAPGGVGDYVRRYQFLYADLAPSQWRRVDWEGPVLDAVESDRRARLALKDLPRRQVWRDRRLMALAAHKRAASRKIGE
jgi:3-hydroxyacyl-CoA dehydrogenase